MNDPVDDADDVFLLDIIDPDEEAVDVFLLDAIDSDGDTADVSIGMSVVLESCDGITDVCVETLIGFNVTPGKIVLNIGFGRAVAIGATLFIVSSQVCFFYDLLIDHNPDDPKRSKNSHEHFKFYPNLCY